MKWAANSFKLQRAITAAGKDAPEASIIEAYRRLGGLVLSEYLPLVEEQIEAIPEVLEVVPVVPVMVDDEIKVADVLPVAKRGRPAKK